MSILYVRDVQYTILSYSNIVGTIHIPNTYYRYNDINRLHLQDVMGNNVIDGYLDVFSIDRSMISIYSNNIYPLGIYIDNVYEGSVWVYKSILYPNYIGIYGIRSSIISYLQGKRGIARKIINYIIETYRGYTIIVPSPLEPMIRILTSYGFNRYDDIDREEYRFISNICSIREYYMYI